MELKTVKVDCGDVNLYPLADLHLGSNESNLREIDRVIKKIKEDEKARVVLLGDILEVATKDSKGDTYTSKSVKDEFNLAIDILSTIKDKIIGMVSGNHERRISKSVGIDISQILAEKLGCANLYSPAFLPLRIRLNYTSWFIVLHHGVGGGRLKGGKINNLHRMGGIFPNADIILMGHTHDFIMTADSKYIFDKRHNCIKLHKTWYINVPSVMYYGGYGASYAYQPAISGVFKIKIPNINQRYKNEVNISIEKA